jgi:hypothetical protein
MEQYTPPERSYPHAGALMTDAELSTECRCAMSIGQMVIAGIGRSVPVQLQRIGARAVNCTQFGVLEVVKGVRSMH